MGCLGLKFLFENCQFLRHTFSWLVGLVGLFCFELVVFSVSCLSSWFVVSGWLVGLVGVEVSLGKFSIFATCFQLVGWVRWVVGFLSW